ncbi:MAG: polysaccharide deacetylase family protein [Tissierellia bacterium]|nr:polysaccharide deacetylase family protein [Tissierellia bacterium]
MIRRIRLPGWIIIIVLLIGITFGINQVIAKVLAESPEPDEEIVDSSVYPGLHMETMTKETELYTLSVSRPYTDNEQIDNPMDEWIDEQMAEFTSGIEESREMLKANNFRAHLNIQVQTEKIADKLYILEFQAYQITGGANGMTKMKSFVIDLNQNKRLRLDDVFELDEHVIRHIQMLITETLYSDQKISTYLLDDIIEEALVNPDEWKWSISQDDVTFYFDEYEIAAGAAGSIEVKISMEDIKLHLNEQFAELIDVDIPDEEEHIEEEPYSEDSMKLDPEGKYVALTFDDGPHPAVTPRILDVLDKHDAKATFFMLGIQAEYYPSLADKVGKEGHEIGSHTMNHQDLTTLEFGQIQSEIQQSDDVIETATSNTPTLLRLPYGASNNNVKRIASKLGYSLVLWSVDSLDWKNRNAAAINREVMYNVVPGSIVLLHDIHPSTADALPQLLTSLKEQGYQMVTVSQLLELWGEKGVGPYYGR